LYIVPYFLILIFFIHIPDFLKKSGIFKKEVRDIG
jgi:hypothetical protein